MGNSSSDPHRHFSQYFESGDRLGAGTFAVVKKCTRKKDGHEFAVKIIDKRHLTGRELVGLQDEIRILQTIKHPNVISSVDAFDDGRRVKIVLELCAGGDLFDQILKSPNRRFSEEQSARVTAVTARALKALHDSCVVHRDLKPENILFTENGVLKITDFGLAHYLKLPPELHIMHTCCGTPHYVAPEVLASNEYGVEVDFWSLGVILYIMLSGYQPFNSHSIHAMYGMIIRGQYRFPSPHWDHVTEEAKDCVKKLMCVEAKARLNADTLFDHPWINQHVDLNQLVEEESRLREEIRRIHVGDDERKDGGADHSRSSDRERERERDRDRDRRHNDGDVSMSDKTKAPEKAIVEEEAPPVGTNI